MISNGKKAVYLVLSFFIVISLLTVPILSYAQGNIIKEDLEKSWTKDQIKEWLNKGTKIEKMQTEEKSKGANIELVKGSKVQMIELNAEAKVFGQGKIEKAKVNVENIKIDQQVSKIILDSKVKSAYVGGKKVSRSTNRKKPSSGGLSSGSNNTKIVPHASYSGIINQVKGGYGSNKVKLTMTVKDGNRQAIKGYSKENFEVKIDSRPSMRFDEIKEISCFVDNNDGTYVIEFYGDAGETYELKNIKVDSIIIEEGPIYVNVPNQLAVVTSPENNESLDSMISTIHGKVNFNNDTVINSINIEIQNKEHKFLNTDGTWINEQIYLPVSMTGTDFSEWYYNLTTEMIKAINESDGMYYINIHLSNDLYAECYSSVFCIEPIAIEKMFPRVDQSDYYPKYTYLHIQFLEPMKALSKEDLSNKVSLSSSEEEAVEIESCKIGTTCDKCVLFIVNDNLKLDTDYTFSISKGTLKSVSGKSYDEDIEINFKTAHTVLKGWVKSDNDIKDGKLYLLDDEGKEVGSDALYDGGYIFTNMEAGRYTLKVVEKNGDVHKKEIDIEEGKVNKIDMYLNLLKIVETYPYSNQANFYPRYTYLFVRFSEEMQPVIDCSGVCLTSLKGDIVIDDIRVEEKYKDHVHFIIKYNLKPNTKYTLSVPGETLKSTSGNVYIEDINIDFVTPETVLKGWVNNYEDVKDGYIYLLDENGKEISKDRVYTGYIFTNMKGGNYTIKIEDKNTKIFERDVVIKEGQINIFNVNLKH